MNGGTILKKFVCGILIGVILSAFTVSLAAGVFTATKASFPVLVNGKQLVSDKPIVVINGSTYLPLKAIGDALDVKVEWNSPLKRVEVGETPQPSQYSYNNPAPLSTAQTIEADDLLQQYKAEMSVKEIVRGDAAWSQIKAANMFNDPAPEGYEYILAKIYFKLISINDGKSFDLNGAVNINLVSSTGKVYDYASVVAPEPILTANLYEGASSEGWAVYQVKKDDATPKLVFGRRYDGTGGIWFRAY